MRMMDECSHSTTRGNMHMCSYPNKRFLHTHPCYCHSGKTSSSNDSDNSQCQGWVVFPSASKKDTQGKDGHCYDSGACVCYTVFLSLSICLCLSLCSALCVLRCILCATCVSLSMCPCASLLETVCFWEEKHKEPRNI